MHLLFFFARKQKRKIALQGPTDNCFRFCKQSIPIWGQTDRRADRFEWCADSESTGTDSACPLFYLIKHQWEQNNKTTTAFLEDSIIPCSDLIESFIHCMPLLPYLPTVTHNTSENKQNKQTRCVNTANERLPGRAIWFIYSFWCLEEKVLPQTATSNKNNNGVSSIIVITLATLSRRREWCDRITNSLGISTKANFGRFEKSDPSFA